MIVGAAFEAHLEFARQDGRQRMPQEVPRERLGIRRHIEHLVGGRIIDLSRAAANAIALPGIGQVTITVQG